MKTIVIVGGGIGGLCTSIRLLSKGYKTILLEKENSLGGKINRKKYNDYKFDLTASIIMTPQIYEDLFKEVGKDINDYIKMTKLDNTYRVHYSDKTYYDFYHNEKNMSNTLENMEKGLSKEYYNFISTSLHKYLLSKKTFLDKPMINIKEIFNFSSIKNIIEMNLVSSSATYIGEKISNEKLRDFLIFQSMYIGANPYTTSNIYTLIPAITQGYGLSYIKGGLYEYILALEKLIYELGGEIKLNYEVDNIIIKNNKVEGIESKTGNISCDIVVCNVDYPYFIKNLIKEDIKEFKYNKRNLKNLSFSPSVFMIYLGLNKKYEELKLHNIYINENFRKSIEDAFNGEIPSNPSLYLYSPSSIDNSICKENHSVLNIMLRVPNLSYEDILWNDESIKKLRNLIINTIKNIDGLEDIENHIVYEDYLTPRDLSNNYNAYMGNAFGLSHKILQSGYFRPHLKSKEIKSLYFIGSSTHPGNGASVIIDGSKVLCNIISSDLNND